MKITYKLYCCAVAQSSVGEESACNAGDPGLTPGLGRFPGGGNGNPLQYSCLENHMDRGAWRTTVHGVTKSQTQLSDQTTTIYKLYICMLPILAISLLRICPKKIIWEKNKNLRLRIFFKHCLY